MLGLIGKKLGMTQIFDSAGNVVPVTVIAAGPCGVVTVRKSDKNGYSALQLGFGPKKAKGFRKSERIYLEKKNLPLYSKLHEFRVKNEGAFSVGQQITVAAFKAGDKISVMGITKGRGFQGGMKRWGKHGGPDSHGSDFHRRIGSIGMRTWPGRVIKGMKMPGHYGDEQVTIKNLKVIDIKESDNLLLVEGAIPGSKGCIVYIYNQQSDFETRIKADKPAATEAVSEQPKEANTEEVQPNEESKKE